MMKLLIFANFAWPFLENDDVSENVEASYESFMIRSSLLFFLLLFAYLTAVGLRYKCIKH